MSARTVVIALAVLVVGVTAGLVRGRGPTSRDATVVSVRSIQPGVAIAAGELVLNGRAVPMAGMNLPNPRRTNLVAAGCTAPIDLDRTFDALGSGSLSRVWLTQGLATDADTGARDWGAFDALVAAARSHPNHPRLIVTLATQSGDCNDGRWLGRDFYAGAWRDSGGRAHWVSYRHWVTEVMARYGRDRTVAIWELVNEPEPVVCDPGYAGSGCYGHGTCPDDAETVLRAFVDGVAPLVRAGSPHALISMGEIGGRQCGWASELVSASPHLDVLSYHDYASHELVPAELATRVALGRRLGKPVVVGEAGMDAGAGPGCRTHHQRAVLQGAKMDAAFSAGVSAYVLWNVQSAPSLPCDLSILPGDPLFDVVASS